MPTPTLPLPDEPSFEQLRNQARELQRAVRSGASEALAEVARRHQNPPLDPAAVSSFRLSAAQLVIARRYDFDSWTRLKRQVELIERYSRFPSRILSAGPADLADRFLALSGPTGSPSSRHCGGWSSNTVYGRCPASLR